MSYKVLRGINWLTPSNAKKKKAGKDYVESRAEAGDSISETELKGADVKWLEDVGAVEKEAD